MKTNILTVEYLVSVPSKESFFTSIGYSFKGDYQRIIVVNHELFHSLPEDAKIYEIVDPTRWDYAKQPKLSKLTINDLREMRREFISNIRPGV